jgi:phage terminase large subunit-like protein
MGQGGSDYYLFDLIRKRMAYPDLLQAAMKAVSDFNPDSILIEDAGSETSLPISTSATFRRRESVTRATRKAVSPAYRP